MESEQLVIGTILPAATKVTPLAQVVEASALGVGGNKFSLHHWNYILAKSLAVEQEGQTQIGWWGIFSAWQVPMGHTHNSVQRGREEKRKNDCLLDNLPSSERSGISAGTMLPPPECQLLEHRLLPRGKTSEVCYLGQHLPSHCSFCFSSAFKLPAVALDLPRWFQGLLSHSYPDIPLYPCL